MIITPFSVYVKDNIIYKKEITGYKPMTESIKYKDPSTNDDENHRHFCR